jgi:hypothetical protein
MHIINILPFQIGINEYLDLDLGPVGEKENSAVTKTPRTKKTARNRPSAAANTHSSQNQK